MSDLALQLKQLYYESDLSGKKKILIQCIEPFLEHGGNFVIIYNHLTTTSDKNLVETDLDEVFEIIIQTSIDSKNEKFQEAQNKLKLHKDKILLLKQLEQEERQKEEQEISSLFDNI